MRACDWRLPALVFHTRARRPSTGSILIKVDDALAPLGAARFLELVKSNYFDGVRFFRNVPGFVTQFGIAADPKVTQRWKLPLKDDPVKAKNVRGTISFATSGPNTRTTQLFINLGDNRRLDSMGFAPFATVVRGMETVDEIFAGYGERPDQGQITALGNDYLNKSFPKVAGRFAFCFACFFSRPTPGAPRSCRTFRGRKS